MSDDLTDEDSGDDQATLDGLDLLREHFEVTSFDREPTEVEREQAAREAADDDSD